MGGCSVAVVGRDPEAEKIHLLAGRLLGVDWRPNYPQKDHSAANRRGSGQVLVVLLHCSDLEGRDAVPCSG